MAQLFDFGSEGTPLAPLNPAELRQYASWKLRHAWNDALGGGEGGGGDGGGEGGGGDGGRMVLWSGQAPPCCAPGTLRGLYHVAP